MNLINKWFQWFKQKPKRLMIVLIALITVISSWAMMKQNESDEGVIQREYTVTKGTITVGVDASGKLTSKRTIQSFSQGLIFEEYLVAQGSEVKKGQALAKISLENLSEVIEKLEKEAADAKDSVIQAGNAVLRYQLQASLNADEKQYNTKEKYETDLKQITDELDDLSKQLEALEKQKLTLSSDNKEGLEEEKKNLEKSLKEARSELDEIEAARDEEVERERRDEAYQRELHKEQEKAYQLAVDKAEEAVKEAESSSDLDAIKKAKEELELAKAALNVFQMQNYKSLYERKEASKIAYEERKSKVEKKISELRSQIRNLSNKSEEVLAKQKKELDKKMDELKEKIAKTNARLETLKKNREEELKREEASTTTQNKLDELELSSLKASEQRANRVYDTALKELEKAKRYYDEPILYAESDGILLAAPYRSKEKISDEKAVVEIGSLEEMELELVIEPMDINDIEIGQYTSISVSVFPTVELEGEVLSKNLAINEGNYSIKVKLKENSLNLLEGMVANATIVTKQKKDILILSNKAIQLVDGKQIVKIKDDKGKLQTIEITTGFSDGQVTEILSGLLENDVVIVEDSL